MVSVQTLKVNPFVVFDILTVDPVYYTPCPRRVAQVPLEQHMLGLLTVSCAQRCRELFHFFFILQAAIIFRDKSVSPDGQN